MKKDNQPKEGVTVVLEANLKEDKREELIDFMTKYLPQTRQYKGLIDITIHTNEDTKQVLFFEKWERKEDFESYFQWRLETGVVDILLSIFSTPPVVRYFTCENV